MSDRYYIYCKYEGEKLLPFAYMDYDGEIIVKGEPGYHLVLPKWIRTDSEVVIKTFKDNSDYIQPLIMALRREDWEEVECWVEDLTTQSFED